jgi:multiple sugar transport system permease protein
MSFKNPLQSKSEIYLRNIVVSAMIIFFSIFLIIPIVMALVGSFHNWNPLSGDFSFIGLENYKTLIKSSLFWKSTYNTLIFCVVVIFFRVALGLGIAYIIFSPMVKKKELFRTVFFMPVVTPLVAVAFVWKFMYHPQIGVFNNLLNLHVNWLMNSKTALLSIMIMTIWKDVGYAIVLFIAGLYSLPTDALEAAEIDGASTTQTFWKISWPLLKPMTLFVVITSLISYLQAYVQVLILTEGGPGTSTYLSSYTIFNEAFVKYNFGYASAMSFVLFLITALLTYISFKVADDKEGSK